MKLIKFLLKFILVIVIIVVILLGITIFAVSDKTNDVNYDYYGEETTTNEVLKPIVKDAFDHMGENYALDFSFDEKTVNKLIYTIIKTKLNTEYNPKTGTTDKEKYINSDYGIPENVAIVGGKKIIVKSCYAEFDNDNLYLNITADGLGIIKTRVRLGLNVTTTDDEYVFDIVSARLGKIDLQKGLGKLIFNSLISTGAINVDNINDNFKEKGIPLVLNLEELKIISNKKDLGEYVTKIVVDNSSTEEEPLDPSVVAFLGIITNPDNKMLNLTSNDGALTLDISLEKLKLAQSELSFDEELKKEFNFETFAKTKTQALSMGLLAGGTDNVITFSEMELGRLLYTKTNGYESLGYSTMILNDIEFKLKIYGVSFNISKETFKINIFVDINGLKTKAVMDCSITYPNPEKDVIHINIPKTAKLGTIDVDCAFLSDMLAKTMSDDDSILKYEKNGDDAYLVITKDIMNNFLASAGSETPVNVNKVEFVENALAIYVGIADPTISALLNDVTDALTSAMSTINTSEIPFDTTDPEQAAAVNNMNSQIENVSAIINDPGRELSNEDTDALIAAYNGLSEDNQEAFITEIQNIFETNGDNDKFTDLYGELFTSND